MCSACRWVFVAEIYTAERRVAVHEAGHAVMAYLVGRPFTTITVVADDDSYGRVHCALPGDWFQPDIKFTSRVRTRIEDHVMIALAGAETEGHWIARSQDAPDDWEDHLKVGAAHDMSTAWDLASYACGSAEETTAYIEWLRQRVLNKVGRWNTEGEAPTRGNDRFWRLVNVLADAVVAAGTLRWRQARNVLQTADRKWLDDKQRRVAS
jgi:hypothetical protein